MGTRRIRAGCAALAACLGLALAPSAAVPASSICCGPFQQPGQMAISADGRFLYVADYHATLALRRDQETGALTLIDSYDGGGTTLELAPDGRHIYVGGYRGYAPNLSTFARDPDTGTLTAAGGWTWEGVLDVLDLEALDDRTLYATYDVPDSSDGALAIVAREPESGELRTRRVIRNGDGGIEMGRTGGIAFAPDRSALYVSSSAPSERRASVSGFRIGPGGDLEHSPSHSCVCYSSSDIEVMPDGLRLVMGPSGPTALDRDPASGQFTERYGPTHVQASRDETSDAALLPDPSGARLYAADFGGDRIHHLESRPDELALRRTYRDGPDAQGLDSPRTLALSPDGRHLYVAAGTPPTSQTAGRVVVFRRDPATGDLAFASLFTGPFLDGRPSGTRASVVIDGGAEYTRDRRVDLTFDGLGSYEMPVDVSNDGGFRGSRKLSVLSGRTYPWTLDGLSGSKLPRTVYVRMLGREYPEGPLISDSIVLDDRPPEVVAARMLPRRRVRVKARDDVSGIARMQVTRRTRRPGPWRPYSRSTIVPRGKGAVYVRVRDRARNRSAWRTVRGGSGR